MDQQESEDDLAQAVFDTFNAFKEACKKADDSDLHIYVHMEGNTFKEVFGPAAVEISKI